MKKTLKVFAKVVLVLVLLPLVVYFYFWIKNINFIGKTDDEAIEYLTHNKQDITLRFKRDELDTRLFDDTFYNSQVFFLGESHGYADVQLVDKYMLMHLNRELGVRHYIAEMDSIRAYRLNLFLEQDTKDSLLLKQVVRDIRMRIPQQSSKELYQKWLDIYDYNKTLPDSLKITVIGVDKDFEDTSRAIERDSMMLVNFKRAVERQGLENEKFYGFFGYTHVLQSSYGEENIYPFAAKIKRSDLPFANKVQSIVCLTLDSEMSLPKNHQFPSPPDEKTSLINSDGPVTIVKGIKDLRAVTHQNTITLFSLNSANSPYKRNQNLAGIKVNLVGNDILPSNTEQKTTGFFQYAILVRNSKALTSLEPN
ncbi:hypothetical protein [Pontibacter harenae]|uniref:hypothetical protein n=1 Tax=Pontibacter harenae TaxID=2894083 RepID=UPI001E5D0242|nr:hypothetical protein [Pontibacter harenae]MCC9165229.1 hypothetical protein [Pontibacter harenae]